MTDAMDRLRALRGRMNPSRDEFLVGLASVKVAQHTRVSSKGKVYTVSSYTRNVRGLDVFDLSREVLELDRGNLPAGMSQMQARNRRQQVVNEQRRRGLNPEWEANLAELLDRPLDEGTLADFRGPYGQSISPHLVTDDNGNVRISPERQRLQKQILDKTLKNGKPSRNKVFNMMGGGPASGKGVLVSSDPSLEKDSVVINPDDVKAELPEYHKVDGSKDAGFVHEESSHLAKVMQSEAFNRSFNVTLDGTGDSGPDKLRKKIRQARENGYAVNGHYVTTDTDTAVERAMKRGERTGRFVDEDILRGTHRQVSATLAEVYPEFDSLRLLDTTVPKGQSPLPVMTFEKGKKTKIHDQKLWARFLAKAGE